MIRGFDKTLLLGEPGPRRNLRLVLGGLLLFDALFYLFGIGPLSESDRERAQLAVTLRRQVKERTAAVEKLDAIVKKVETARTQGDQMLGDITLPRRTAYSTIVSELDQAAKQAGVGLRDRAFDVEPIEGSDTLSMMSINVGLEATYDNLVKFLNQLDRSPRFLVIDSLGAAPQQAGPNQTSSQLAVSLKLDTFVREASGEGL